MKTVRSFVISFLFLGCGIGLSVSLKAQSAPEDAIVYTIANDTQVNSKQLEFDLLLWDSVPSDPYQMATVQAGIFLNAGIINGGTITVSIIPGTSGLLTSQQPTSIAFTASQNIIKMAAKAPPGCGSGTIISQDPENRTRICRIRLTNTVDYTTNSHANLMFCYTTTPYGTKISHYNSSCYNIASLISPSTAYSMASNVILNPGSACPYLYTVTGGGSFCEGSEGKVVGLSGSDSEVTYTLVKDGVATPVVVSGSGAALSFGLQTTGIYTVLAVNSWCPDGVQMIGNAVVTETPILTPVFDVLGPYCQGSGYITLPTISNNGISGIWSPWRVNTDSVSTADYTFTPATSECAAPLTIPITVNPTQIPVFPVYGPYCINDPPVVLPGTSLNAIPGVWVPPVVSTDTVGVKAYHFYPSAGFCGANVMILITVQPRVVPVFLPLGPYCQYSMPPALPATSQNGIAGTWNPPVINTSSIGTSNYTFTPSSGGCTAVVTMQIEIGTLVQATFAPVGPLCQNSTPPSLPGTSLNGFTGTWSPLVINTSTTGVFTNTFTPDPGQCATITAIQIEIYGLPGNLGLISGPTVVTTANTSFQYSVDTVPGASGYVWAYSGANVSRLWETEIRPLFISGQEQPPVSSQFMRLIRVEMAQPHSLILQ